MLKLHRSKASNQKKKGQSTVEYILLAAAVIGVAVIFLGPSGVFQEKYKGVLNQTTDSMGVMSDRLNASRIAVKPSQTTPPVDDK